MDSLAPIVLYLLFFNFIINELNQTSSLFNFSLWDYFFPIIRQNEQHYWRYKYSMANISMPEIILN